MTARGLRFTVLRGTVGAVFDGEPVALGGPQQRRLLAALLAEHDTIVSADRLVESIWPPDAAPDSARHTVMTYLHRLRTAIGADHLLTRDNGYELVLDGATYDASEFELAIATARAGEPDDAVAAYDRALGLWSGRAFGDDADEWWLRPIAARLEELRLLAFEERAERLIDSGRHGEAVADLERLVAEQPLRERFVELQMRALYLGGRQAEALREFGRFRDYLADETGLPPSDGLIDLEHRIVLGDASLAPSSGVAVPGYELGEVIGEGAFGAVYRAVQPSVGREVAVKVVRADLADDPRFVQRFEAEAQLVARLEHPHVVPLYDYWRRPGGAFLVFRLLRGGSLSERIAEGPMPVPEVTRLVEEMSGALTAAHSLGVVHRDVKPANVLFDEAGNSYLVDFGIATLADAADDTDMRSAGSPMYASPEQARDGTASAASDQYALGVVVWEALTGQAPFAGTTTTEVLQTKLVAAVPLLADRNGVPDALNTVLQRATAPHPDDRYPNVAEFAHAWQLALANAGADAARTTGRLAGETRPRTTSSTLAQLPAVGANPYKGLRAFREADAADFHGRAELVEQLVAAVDAEPFVTVVGPSGSGKSSLVHAGLVPEFRRRGALVVSMVPGTDPFSELEAALRRVATTEDDASIAARLRAPGGLVAVAADLVEPGEQLVLVVDQFEELWTLVDTDQTRDRFAELLTHAAHQESTLRVVVTLRADLYDRPLQHPGLGPVVSHSTFAVTPMTAGELQAAIVAPAERVGVRFEPGLVATMVGDVVSRPGALPLLQFTLTELYEHRTKTTITAAEYGELGGIGGALASRAEQLYTEMNGAGRAGVRSLFTQLVTLGDDNDDLRRRATTEELATVEPSVIDRYLTNRLLVTDHHPITREPTIEVAHEALLREWPRLAEWIDEDRDTIRMRRLITQTATEWHDIDHDESILYRGPRLAAADDVALRITLAAPEREFLVASHELADRERHADQQRAAAQARQNRRLRRLLVTTTAVLVVALVFGVYAVNQRTTANANARRADAARAEALTRGLAAETQSLLQAKRFDAALLVAAQAQQTAAHSGVSGTAAQLANDALLEALTTDPSLAGFFNDQPGVATFTQYSPNGAYLVSRTGSGEVRAWDAATRRELPPPRWHLLRNAFDNVAVNSAGIAAAPSANGVALWDLHANKPIGWQPPAVRGPSRAGLPSGAVAVSDRGLLAQAYGGGPTTLDVWDIARRRHVGAQLTFPGAPIGAAFSPDGTELAVTLDRDSTSVDVQLVNLPGMTLGPLLQAQRQANAFNVILDPFQSAVVFSPDGRQITVGASRGPTPLRGAAGITTVTKGSAIATFDTRSGARISSPAVATGQEFLGLSPDLHEIATETGTDAQQTSIRVVDARTGTQLLQLPVYGLAYTSPVAFDPTRPNLVAQAGPGVLTISDWTQPGAAHFAQSATAALSRVALSSNGITIDLTRALRTLGLSTRCFAPLKSNCNYVKDAPNGVLPEIIPYTATDPRRPWTATAGSGGDVAILTGTEIAIWNSRRRRIERRLTGVPAKCDDVTTLGLAFAGTTRHGRIVLGCPPSLTSWNLDSPDSSPAWHKAWAGPSFNYNPTPIVMSPNNATVAITVATGTQFLDAHDGRVIGSVPLQGVDNDTGGAYSPDGHTYAQLTWSGTVTLADPTTGKVKLTLTSSRGNIGDLGIICSACGASGNPPAVVFSPDGSLVAVWHDSTGIELWNVATGESLAVLGGQNSQQLGTLGALRGNGTLDARFRHRLTATFPSENSLRVNDIHDLVHVVNGAPTTEYTSQLRTVTWSLRPSDWALAACSLVRRDLTHTEWETLVGSTAPYQKTCTPLLHDTRQN